MTTKRDPFLEGIMNRDAKEEPATSRPAAPESETPLVERLEERLRNHSGEWPIELINLVAEAATALSLAQTEIKGRMRVEEELKAELQEAHRELGMIPVGWQPKHDYLLGELAKAQARIAELEKALAEHGTDAPGGIFS